MANENITNVVRTVHGNKEADSVLIDVKNPDNQNDFLEYEVSLIKGAKAIFTLVDSANDEMLLSGKSTPTSTGLFKRIWPTPGDSVSVISRHVIFLNFTVGQKYNFKVTHHRIDGSKELLIDIDYESKNPLENYPESLQVITF